MQKLEKKIVRKGSCIQLKCHKIFLKYTHVSLYSIYYNLLSLIPCPSGEKKICQPQKKKVGRFSSIKHRPHVLKQRLKPFIICEILFFFNDTFLPNIKLKLCSSASHSTSAAHSFILHYVTFIARQKYFAHSVYNFWFHLSIVTTNLYIEKFLS